jgi:hypothetical protein
MVSVLSSTFLLLVLVGPTTADNFGTSSDRSAVRAAVNDFVSAINSGSLDTLTSACAAQDITFIIDEIEPFSWSGKKACERWAAVYDAYNDEANLSKNRISLRKYTSLQFNDALDAAYIVWRADYSYWLHYPEGEKYDEKYFTGSVLTFTLVPAASAGSWQIYSFSWAAANVQVYYGWGWGGWLFFIILMLLLLGCVAMIFCTPATRTAWAERSRTMRRTRRPTVDPGSIAPSSSQPASHPPPAAELSTRRQTGGQAAYGVPRHAVPVVSSHPVEVPPLATPAEPFNRQDSATPGVMVEVPLGVVVGEQSTSRPAPASASAGAEASGTVASACAESL